MSGFVSMRQERSSSTTTKPPRSRAEPPGPKTAAGGSTPSSTQTPGPAPNEPGLCRVAASMTAKADDAIPRSGSSPTRGTTARRPDGTEEAARQGSDASSRCSIGRSGPYLPPITAGALKVARPVPAHLPLSRADPNQARSAGRRATEASARRSGALQQPSRHDDDEEHDEQAGDRPEDTAVGRVVRVLLNEDRHSKAEHKTAGAAGLWRSGRLTIALTFEGLCDRAQAARR